MRWQLTLQLTVGLGLLFLLGYKAADRYVGPPGELLVEHAAAADAAVAAGEGALEWQKLRDAQRRLVRAAAEDPVFAGLGAALPAGPSRDQAIKAGLAALVAEGGNGSQAALVNAQEATVASTGALPVAHSPALKDALLGATSLRVELVAGAGARLVAAAPVAASSGGPALAGAVVLAVPLDDPRVSTWAARLAPGAGIVIASGGDVVASNLPPEKAKAIAAAEGAGPHTVNEVSYLTSSRDLADDAGSALRIIGAGAQDAAALARVAERVQFLVVGLGALAVLLALGVALTAPVGPATGLAAELDALDVEEGSDDEVESKVERPGRSRQPSVTAPSTRSSATSSTGGTPPLAKAAPAPVARSAPPPNTAMSGFDPSAAERPTRSAADQAALADSPTFSMGIPAPAGQGKESAPDAATTAAAYDPEDAAGFPSGAFAGAMPSADTASDFGSDTGVGTGGGDDNFAFALDAAFGAQAPAPAASAGASAPLARGAQPSFAAGPEPRFDGMFAGAPAPRPTSTPSAMTPSAAEGRRPAPIDGPAIEPIPLPSRPISVSNPGQSLPATPPAAQPASPPPSAFDAIAAAALSASPPPVKPAVVEAAMDPHSDLPMPVEHLNLPGLKESSGPISPPTPAIARASRPQSAVPRSASPDPRGLPAGNEDPWRNSAVPSNAPARQASGAPLRAEDVPGRHAEARPPPSITAPVVPPSSSSIPMVPPPSSRSYAANGVPPAVQAAPPAREPMAFDEEHYRVVYNEFVGSKARLGEQVDNITFEGFSTKLRNSEKELIDRHGCKAVRFQVLVKDRQVSLRPQLVR